jgi:hypothetical protein
MPIVINEIVFKGEISQPTAPGEGPDRARRPANAAEKRALIEECVERVVRLLEREKER